MLVATQIGREKKLLEAVQSYVARGSINVSSMRGCPRGTIPSAREYLTTLDLVPFGTEHADRFLQSLNASTDSLRAEIPGHEWGFARKGLNIFLRRCLYNVYLREWHHLVRSELFFEVALDSIVAEQLREASLETDPKLPRWTSIKGLRCADSREYQDAASRIADKDGIARVHLDALWWGGRADGPLSSGESVP